MSNDKNIAKNFGRNNFITIDSNLFRDFIINGRKFLRENAHILKIQPSFTLFQNITLKQVICSLKFFAFHPYTKNMDQIVANTACNEITCYDDFYARPIYD